MTYQVERKRKTKVIVKIHANKKRHEKKGSKREGLNQKLRTAELNNGMKTKNSRGDDSVPSPKKTPSVQMEPPKW